MNNLSFVDRIKDIDIRDVNVIDLTFYNNALVNLFRQVINKWSYFTPNLIYPLEDAISENESNDLSSFILCTNLTNTKIKNIPSRYLQEIVRILENGVIFFSEEEW